MKKDNIRMNWTYRQGIISFKIEYISDCEDY